MDSEQNVRRVGRVEQLVMRAEPTLFAYKLNDRVRIAPLETTGRIVGLYLCEDGAQYRVRYFYEGAARTEYFYDDELHGA